MLLVVLLIVLACDALHCIVQPGTVFVSAAKPLGLRRNPVNKQRNLFITWEETHQAGNLPELEEPVRAPSGDNSVALCTVMKQENSTDVREWLSYYRWLGVDHVYLTENAAVRTPQMAEQLRDFEAEGFLAYNLEPIPRGQTKVYYDCMSQHYHKHNWMMFFDMDEYLILTGKPEQKLPDFLDEYKEFAGLSVHWVIVGPSGQDRRAPAGGVMRTYDHCSATASPWIKTIANTFFLTNIAYHPHNFEFRDGRLTVDEDKKPIPQYTKKKMCTMVPPAISRAGIPWAGESYPVERNGKGEYCTMCPGFRAPSPAPIAKIALFHYITRSREDYEIKQTRGGGSTKVRTWEEFDEFDRLASVTGGVCDLPRQAAENCCPEESFVL
eukprot:jgi/Ulvmu1/10766/UM068_0056.1